MKKLLLSVTFLCAAATCFAQQTSDMHSAAEFNSHRIMDMVSKLANVEASSRNKMHNQQLQSYTVFDWGGNWNDTSEYYTYLWTNGLPIEGVYHSYASGNFRKERAVMKNFVVFHNNGGIGTMNGYYPTEIEVFTKFIEWDKSAKVKINFTPNGHISSTVTDAWNDTDEEYVPSIKTEYTYDSKGNFIGSTNYAFNGTAWEETGGFRYKTTYDANGNLKQVNKEIYNTISKSWLTNYYEIYTTDAQGKVTSVILHDELIDVKDSVSIDWYKYDGKIDYNDSHEGYALRNLGLIKEFKRYRRSGTVYNYHSKDSFSYNAAGLKTYEGVLLASGSGHVVESEKTFEYYANGDLKLASSYERPTPASPLEYVSVVEYTNTYDAKNDPQERIRKEGDNPSVLTNEQKEVFKFYANTGIGEEVQSFFTMYPNPANNAINISLDKPASQMNIQVMDLAGRVLARENFRNLKQGTLNVASLASGSYIICVETDGQKSYKQFVKN